MSKEVDAKSRNTWATDPAAVRTSFAIETPNKSSQAGDSGLATPVMKCACISVSVVAILLLVGAFTASLIAATNTQSQVLNTCENNLAQPKAWSPPPPRPTRFMVPYVTPAKNQAERSTCWDFATIAMLEQSYRMQGIKMGFLDNETYVSFSEQAWGVGLMRLCADPKYKEHFICSQSNIGKNSTEGGFGSDLFYFPMLSKTALHPEKICPYIKKAGRQGAKDTDALCPGFVKDTPSKNPLSFSNPLGKTEVKNSGGFVL